MAKDLILESKTNLQSIDGEIRRIEGENLRIDKSTTKGCLGGVLAAIACLVTLVMGADSGFSNATLGAALVFAGCFVLAVIYNEVLSRRMWKTARLPALKAILRALEADVPPDAAVTLTADCRGLEDEAHVKERQGGGVFDSTEQIRYEDPWLELRFRTRDGSTVSLAASESSKKKIKFKRKGRRKVRASKTMRVRIKISASAKSFMGIDKGFSAMEGHVVGNVRVVAASSRGRVLTLTTTAADQKPEWLVLRSLALAYGQLRPALGAKVRKKLGKQSKDRVA